MRDVGLVGEWLSSGLQNRVHQFKSGRGLKDYPGIKLPQFADLYYLLPN